MFAHLGEVGGLSQRRHELPVLEPKQREMVEVVERDHLHQFACSAKSTNQHNASKMKLSSLQRVRARVWLLTRNLKAFTATHRIASPGAGALYIDKDTEHGDAFVMQVSMHCAAEPWITVFRKSKVQTQSQAIQSTRQRNTITRAYASSRQTRQRNEIQLFTLATACLLWKRCARQ